MYIMGHSFKNVINFFIFLASLHYHLPQNGINLSFLVLVVRHKYTQSSEDLATASRSQTQTQFHSDFIDTDLHPHTFTGNEKKVETYN